jgi:hypothetical protein
VLAGRDAVRRGPLHARSFTASRLCRFGLLAATAMALADHLRWLCTSRVVVPKRRAGELHISHWASTKTLTGRVRVERVKTLAA